jgi:hypothetical protein
MLIACYPCQSPPPHTLLYGGYDDGDRDLELQTLQEKSGKPYMSSQDEIYDGTGEPILGVARS